MINHVVLEDINFDMTYVNLAPLEKSFQFRFLGNENINFKNKPAYVQV